MYLPQRFKNRNEAESLEIIRKYPLATLISVADNGPFISHLPLVIDPQQKELVLVGHLARANPHGKVLKQVTAIFHGPNAYITPQWYVENDVPTWNYVVVHIKGRVELIEDKNGIIDCLKLLTAQSEAGFENPWEFWIPEDLSNLAAAIVGFRIVVEELSAKFKLSQNRSVEDQKGAIAGLDALGEPRGLEVSQMMKERLI